MNHTFISIQGSYKSTQIAIFKKSKYISSTTMESKKASSHLVPTLDKILKENALSVSDLDFIATNQGPGSFTSLRVLISTLNAIAYTGKITLIGVDGLDALAFEVLEKTKMENGIIISLLNAFNKDVFFGVFNIENQKFNLIIPKGYKNISIFLAEIKTKYPNQNITFCGNASLLFKNLIQEPLNAKAIIPDNLPTISSAKQIGLLAIKRWENKKNISSQLKPTYLKIQKYKPKYSSDQ